MSNANLAPKLQDLPLFTFILISINYKPYVIV